MILFAKVLVEEWNEFAGLVPRTKEHTQKLRDLLVRMQAMKKSPLWESVLKPYGLAVCTSEFENLTKGCFVAMLADSRRLQTPARMEVVGLLCEATEHFKKAGPKAEGLRKWAEARARYTAGRYFSVAEKLPWSTDAPGGSTLGGDMQGYAACRKLALLLLPEWSADRVPALRDWDAGYKYEYRETMLDTNYWEKICEHCLSQSRDTADNYFEHKKLPAGI